MEINNLISIIIPCRNEEKFIKNCLSSVLDFKIPSPFQVEVFIVDGISTDKTVEIVKDFLRINPNFILLRNDAKIQSVAINIGIAASNGKWIMRLDAHSIYPEDYLDLCLKTAIETVADNVGGVLITLPGDSSYSALIVQSLTTHKFGVGNSRFRTDFRGGYTDTVPYGFFKKEIFQKIGFFNEKLVRAQDYEFNKRIVKNGGMIWLNPSIMINYYNQKSFLKFLNKQLKLDAPYNVYMWYVSPFTFSLRHAVTGLFTFGIFAGITSFLFSPSISMIFSSVMVMYSFLAILSALQLSIRYKKILHLFILPLCFFLFHFIHGLGILIGITKIIFKNSPVNKK